MSGHLKAEINQIVASSQPKIEAAGWRLRKTGPCLSRQLCPGVTQHLLPRFTYIEKGLICLCQPIAPVESAAVGKVLRQLFGAPGMGPCVTTFRLTRPDLDRRSPGLKSKFDVPKVHFVDVDAPGFGPEKGFYQTEHLPDYLMELCATVDRIIPEDYDIASETSFLRALPEDCDPETVATRFHGNPYGALVSLAVTRILCGEIDVVSRILAGGGHIYPRDRDLLAQVDAAARDIAPLA